MGNTSTGSGAHPASWPKRLSLGIVAPLLGPLKPSSVAAILILAFAAGCVHPVAWPDKATIDGGARRFSIEGFDGSLLAAQIFLATNRVRADHGLRPLRHMSELDASADVQAEHNSLMGSYEHDNPVKGEHTVSDRIAKAGVVASFVAENAILEPSQPPSGSPDSGYSYEETAEKIVQDWIGSPVHRANILDPKFNRLGCAARTGHVAPWDQRIYVIQDFCEVDDPAPEVPRTFTPQR